MKLVIRESNGKFTEPLNLELSKSKYLALIKKHSLKDDGYFDWYDVCMNHAREIYEGDGFLGLSDDSLFKAHYKEFYKMLYKCFPYQQQVKESFVDIMKMIPSNWAEGYWTQALTGDTDLKMYDTVFFTNQNDLLKFRLSFL